MHQEKYRRLSRLISVKRFVSLLGQKLPARFVYNLQSTLNYVKLGQWLQTHHFEFERRVKSRQDVWACVATQVCNDKVLYLEFGVARGDSIRYWSKALKHPESKLHGFDSFEGLPEQGGIWAKGQFSTGGQIPKIDDPRVKFIKGWFCNSLPQYVVPSHETLIINMDADLYSSTIFVLRHLLPYIKPGTFICFDEMNIVDHEPRAIDEFLFISKVKFVPLCADKTGAVVFFLCV